MYKNDFVTGPKIPRRRRNPCLRCIFCGYIVLCLSDENAQECRHGTAGRQLSDELGISKEDKHKAKFEQILKSDCPDLGWFYFFFGGYCIMFGYYIDYVKIAASFISILAVSQYCVTLGGISLSNL